MTNAVAQVNRLVVHDEVDHVMDTARFEHMWRIAKAMSDASLMGEHLRGRPSDCLLVVEQSNRWGMSPFAVAPCTYSVGGKLGYEGKLVAAVVNARAGLTKRLSYTYEGIKPPALAVTVSGTLQGENEPRTIRATWEQGFSMSKGAKDKWQSQPEQQLAYFGARVWARRHTPEVLLGVYTPEELAAAEAHIGPDYAKDVTQERPAITEQPQYVELFSAHGEVFLLEPGTVDAWIKDQIESATDEELDALAEQNDHVGLLEALSEEADRRLKARESNGTQEPAPAAQDHTAHGTIAEQRGKRHRRGYRQIVADVIAAILTGNSPDEIDKIIDDGVTGGVRSNAELMAQIEAAKQRHLAALVQSAAQQSSETIRDIETAAAQEWTPETAKARANELIAILKDHGGVLDTLDEAWSFYSDDIRTMPGPVQKHLNKAYNRLRDDLLNPGGRIEDERQQELV